ncbi:Sodium channel protein type 11 subunit alpha [Symbiodinium microadriaticum]|uniref:Sodium channel protein type 11 subunit alpha n=1 Tax=Symbiodinium microadriaticum TaxID=2951 RepID=A0A1Q9EGG0_SYMMI|nr:Sodium channel protein type 11 subunit alpha [Symbiodinium microadriaticum]CAE7204685.1 SCN11A [Symbiodinium sp. KB8]CAE7575785.1 SCN11A [Symbiodinium microadriaticum]
MAASEADASPASPSDDEKRAAVHPDTALLLATMQRHHELVMERLCQQDVLLSRAAHGSDAPSSRSRPAKVLPQTVETRKQTSASFSDIPPSEVSHLPARGNEVPLRSYTEEDSQLRVDADQAESMTMRQRFSVHVGDYGTPRRRLGGPTMSWASLIVQNPTFDAFFGLVVMANSIFIGMDIQWVLGDQGPRPTSYTILHYSFSLLFLLELALRIADSRGRYYCSEDWAWAILDTVIVLSSLWDVIVEVIQEMVQDNSWESFSGLSTLKAMRIVRLTRVLKTVQFVRLFRFVMALRTLVQSILHTMKALFWALLLLGLIIYVFAILFSQAVFDYKSDPANPELPADVLDAATRYFGTLLTSMIALFMSITGGVSWEEVLKPLGYVSDFWKACFIWFIAFSYLAVLNVVTAVFCQSAIESAQSDHATLIQNMLDNKEQHLQKLRTLFDKIGHHDVGGGGITFPMFEEKISSQTVRDYFEMLGLDVWDPWAFFKLLDSDAGGVVELEEFFLGCLRFSGAATAMEVGQVAADQKWLIKSHGRFQKFVEEELHRARADISCLTDALLGYPPVSSTNL